MTGSISNPDGSVTVVSPAVNAAIAADGAVLDNVRNTGVSIFANGADTRTRGADLTFDFPMDYGFAKVDWSIGGTYTFSKSLDDASSIGAGRCYRAVDGCECAVCYPPKFPIR